MYHSQTNQGLCQKRAVEGEMPVKLGMAVCSFLSYKLFVMIGCKDEMPVKLFVTIDCKECFF